MWRAIKDSEPKGPKRVEYVDAWTDVLRSQPFSVSQATEYEGWRIQRVSPLTRTGERR